MKKYLKKIELEKAGAKLPRRIVERKIKKEIMPWLEREEVIVLLGARQTGKSVIMSQLIYGHLLPKTTNIHYFNLDIKKNLKFFDSHDGLIINNNDTKTKNIQFPIANFDNWILGF